MAAVTCGASASRYTTTGAQTAGYSYDGDHDRVGSTVKGIATRGYLLDLAAGLPTIVQQATAGITTYLYGNGLLGQDNNSGPS